MANARRRGSTQNLSSNEGSSSFVFTNSLGNEEHTPSREKGKKRKKDNEVFSPERDMNFLMNPKRQHVSKFSKWWPVGIFQSVFMSFYIHFVKVFNYARLLDWTKRLRAYSL